MNLHIGRRGTAAALGLIGAATLWAVTMQLGLVLPYPDCRHQQHFAGLSSVVAVAVAAIAGGYSSRVYRNLRQRPARPASGARRSLELLAGIGIGSAALFLFPLVLQACAGFILTGCER